MGLDFLSFSRELEGGSEQKRVLYFLLTLMNLLEMTILSTLFCTIGGKTLPKDQVLLLM